VALAWLTSDLFSSFELFLVPGDLEDMSKKN
jgi:hypothetical protein